MRTLRFRALPRALVAAVARSPGPWLVALASLVAACDPAGPVLLGSWTERETGTGATILDAAYGSETFVIVGLHGTVARSPDGRDWSIVNGGFDSHLTGLSYSAYHGSFIAATHDGHGQGRTIATSPDGRTWTRRRVPRTNPLREVACGGEVCVAVGDEGAVLRSTDLVAWQDVSFTGGGFRWIAVIHTGSGFVISGGREQIAWSPDGLSWATRKIPITLDMDPSCTPPTPSCNDIDDVAYTGRRFVAVAHPTPGLWVSEDLETWERRDIGAPDLPQEVRGLWSALSAGGITLVGGGAGKLATSYDHGLTWELLDPGFGDDGIWALAYGEGQYLAAGESGRVATARLR